MFTLHMYYWDFIGISVSYIYIKNYVDDNP